MKAVYALILFLLASTAHAQSLRLPGADSQPASIESAGRRVDLSTEEKLKRDIDTQALAVANRLMRCCSS